MTDDVLHVDTRTPMAGVRVVCPEGEVDMITAPALLDALNRTTRGEVELVVIDLDEITFLGSAGLASLISAHESAEQAGITVCLAGGSRVSRRALQISGVDALFDHHDTVDVALQVALRIPRQA